MEREERLKILRQLSETPGNKAREALRKELDLASKSLRDEVVYYTLRQVLEEVSIYAFRLHAEALNAIRSFLIRLDGQAFVAGTDGREFAAGFNVQGDLAKMALEIVERTRYFDLKASLEIFSQYAMHENEMLRKASIDALKKCAAFDFDIYFSGEHRAGLGTAPQLETIEYLEANRQRYADGNLEVPMTLARQLLSPTIEGTSWDYQSVVWSSGGVPVSDSLADIRIRTLRLLMALYHRDLSEESRRSLIASILAAMDMPRRGEVDQELQTLIEANTLFVFDWLKVIIPVESFPMRQKLEHDVYWRFYHGISEAIRSAALEIHDLLAADEEYQIYRNLIGFQSIFEDWEESLGKQRDFSRIEEERRNKAREYVGAITDDNWPEWRSRLIRFCATRSDDLAMFPIFYDFLAQFAEVHPACALELVTEYIDDIRLFEIPIFRGIWNSNHREDLKPILEKFVLQGDHLTAMAKMFINERDVDRILLEAVVDAAVRTNDAYALSQLLLVAAANYESDKVYYSERLFVRALACLDEIGDSDWVQQIWYRRNVQELVADLSEPHLAIVLKALERVERISFQSEDILTTIAERHPLKVLELFRRRIARKEKGRNYEAVPFDVHGLEKPFSGHAQLAVDTVKSWHMHEDPMFQFEGGHLIAVLFPNFGDDLEAALLLLAKSGAFTDAKFVIGILRNYHGETFLHNVCRQLIISHAKDDELKTDVMIVLLSTGVVSGEFGMAEAYEQKAEEIEYWLSDEAAEVQDFAKSYITSLKADALQERRRAEEELELRKHRFGEREDKAE
ncbi:hypothetical protein [Hyphomonas sp. ND6WE1B]|uniref:hypothetical protein n=1 Tax=Hyphomonas sp. ND6WE1B TaxID=1848191 RepID=UPI0008076CDB|nr:hypothetical protein [Hyphomonas sp. ND6WE1B]